ncbi:hypothetical protein CL615_00265 [archaeon]|mgnify:CR=1 FL=1|jgi:hypothetical protein|nr:hypothetical protein [archaeon]MDP6547420.1 hypothetical protein [Candidatus Woesearchaeota archaeon]|tara:strand:+ start:17786 stop:18400 length:615 start_codon:yes stop_codon:yes gene_type:complete
MGIIKSILIKLVRFIRFWDRENIGKIESIFAIDKRYNINKTDDDSLESLPQDFGEFFGDFFGDFFGNGAFTYFDLFKEWKGSIIKIWLPKSELRTNYFLKSPDNFIPCMELFIDKVETIALRYLSVKDLNLNFINTDEIKDIVYPKEKNGKKYKDFFDFACDYFLVWPNKNTSGVIIELKITDKEEFDNFPGRIISKSKRDREL